MKRKIYHYLLASACLVVLSAGKIKAQAQPDYLHCTTDNAMDELFRNHPEARAQYEELTRNAQQNLAQYKLQHPVLPTTSGPPQFIIPVVFHIIHQYGSEDISDAQVQDEIDILNIDYRKRNPDTANASAPFQSLHADAKIEFRLATKDPNGNCTNGIEHIYSHLTNQGGDDSKLDPWPRNRYLNIWIVKTIGAQGAAGYAYYPSAVTGVLFTIDGVIMLSDYVGSIGTGNVFTSRSISHELGHYLNLQHTWGNNNNAGVACGDDGIADTPPTKGWLNCPALQPPLYMNRVVCSLPNDTVVENVENYMEYSYCSVMFTVDQVAAMHQTLQSNVSYRDCTVSYYNHVMTGTDSVTLQTATHPYCFGNPSGPSVLPYLPLCTPEADFSANRYYVCQGGTVTFTDHSWRGAPTSWSWSIPNGTPSTSTAANPTITCPTWGWQDVTLTATNASCSGTTTRHNYIYVAPPWADYFGAFTESFENNNFNNQWVVESMEYSYPQWAMTSSAAYTGSKSIWMNAFGEDRLLLDATLSASYDLSTCSNATLNFKYSCASAAQINADITEYLKVYVSNNCGQTWTLRKTLSGTTLCNAGFYPSSFTPTSQSQWASCSVQLQNTDCKPNTRFRFEYMSGKNSNNIFIDDINLTATVGVNEIENYNFDLNVFPNPSNGENLVNVSYTLTSSESVKITLVDMVGREVTIVNNAMEQPGEKTVTIDRNALNLKAGVYLVKISNGSSYDTRKLVITN